MSKLDAPERYEQLIAFLGSNLPHPVQRDDDSDGSIRFIGGDPPEVVVLLTHSSVVVAEFTGEWETPLTFTAKPRRIGTVKWRRLSESALFNSLSALIKGAREARLASFQTCQYCEQRTAPEWLHDEGVCQSCADQHSGSIH
jgi:hypothetical protein